MRLLELKVQFVLFFKAHDTDLFSVFLFVD